jgi:AcrR family transcriptional regulator
MPRSLDPAERRARLVSAAASTFAKRGVANTPVSEIVKAAGVAQGTFYLYFTSKDDIVHAVVERFADTIADALTGAVAGSGASAAEEIQALCSVLGDLTAVPGAAELVALAHAPENRAIHDRLTEQFMPRLVPLLQGIIEEGVAQGVFAVPDPGAAAWFVLGGLRSVELAGTSLAEMPRVLAATSDLVLRALGHQETRA